MLVKVVNTNAAAKQAGQAAEPPLIRLEHVSLRFGDQDVLRDVSVHVRRGETLAIIGESGCGKTVLLKLIIGLLQPTAGRILFDSKELATLTGEEQIRQRLRFGFVFQGAALFDSMTVFDNVAFPLRQHTNKTPDQIRAAVQDRLGEVGLPAEAAGKHPAELSGGMRKRVGLARALVLQPEVVLYDEPTTGLDPIMSDVINRLILQTHRRHGVTSIVVTHDMNTVRKVADRVVMLYPLRGLGPGEPQIVFQGTVAELEACGDLRIRQFVRGESEAQREGEAGAQHETEGEAWIEGVQK